MNYLGAFYGADGHFDLGGAWLPGGFGGRVVTRDEIEQLCDTDDLVRLLKRKKL